jgi:hypothetical protein
LRTPLRQIRALHLPALLRNFEFWYQYATGYNPDLNKSINDTLAARPQSGDLRIRPRGGGRTDSAGTRGVGAHCRRGSADHLPRQWAPAAVNGTLIVQLVLGFSSTSAFSSYKTSRQIMIFKCGVIQGMHDHPRHQ